MSDGKDDIPDDLADRFLNALDFGEDSVDQGRDGPNESRPRANDNPVTSSNDALSANNVQSTGAGASPVYANPPLPYYTLAANVQPTTKRANAGRRLASAFNRSPGKADEARHRIGGFHAFRAGPQGNRSNEAQASGFSPPRSSLQAAALPARGRVIPVMQAPMGAMANAASSPRAPGSPSEMYNWQSTKGTVKERLVMIFGNEVMSDVHFCVGRGPASQRIPAHKFILSIGSAVFDAMFNGRMAANTTEDIVLPDVEPASFLALLKFLYTDEVNIDEETVMTTLYTAKKYAVPALEGACVEFLKRNLSSDNAFMLLTQARLFDETPLAKMCLETIDKNTSEALAAEGFTDIDLDTLCVVLERDTLGIRECKLFEAVCRWAEAECERQGLPVDPVSKRQALGRALGLIRFPLMSVEEFAGGSAQTGILTDREVVELFLYFTVNPKPTVSFIDQPRCCLTGREQVINRFCQVESRWGYSGCSDRIRFMVNRRIFVVGFGLYGTIHGPGEYLVVIQIIHTETNKVLGSNNSTFLCDGSTNTSRVMFKEPVEIAPNTNYTACATLKGTDSYYGTKGLRKVVHESVDHGKIVFQFTFAAGNSNGTTVEDGQIPEIIFYT